MDLDKFLNKLYNDDNNDPASGVEYPDPVATPSPGLNWAINGGIRPGGFYCFEGPESSGKSYMALCCVAEMLKADPTAVAFWFDVEQSFSKHFADILLPDPEDQKRLIVRKCVTGSDIFDYFKNTVVGLKQEGLNVVCCVVDSLNMIIAPKEANLKSSEDHVMGDLAAYLPKALRMVAGPSKPRLKHNEKGVAWIFISQVRDNLDPMAKYTGEKYTIPGGRAFRHALECEILFEIIQSNKTKLFDESIKNMNDADVQIGHRVRAKVKKNKFGPPSRVIEFDFMYSKGIVNQSEEIADLGIKLGLIRKEGNTYYFGDTKLAVGEEKTLQAIAESEDIQQSILKAIMEKSNDENASNR